MEISRLSRALSGTFGVGGCMNRRGFFLAILGIGIAILAPMCLRAQEGRRGQPDPCGGRRTGGPGEGRRGEGGGRGRGEGGRGPREGGPRAGGRGPRAGGRGPREGGRGPREGGARRGGGVPPCP